MSPEKHISKQFDAELDHVRGLICAMGNLAERQLSASLKSLDRGDAGLLQHLSVLKSQARSMEIEIGEACASVIARRQPASADLRFLISALKAMTDLVRIGDEAGKIAFIAHRKGSRLLAPSRAPEIPRMGTMAMSMLGRALSMFAYMDVAGAAELARTDLELDGDLRCVLQRLLVCMTDDPRTISGALDAIFVAKSLERIGDHACNLSEHVVYIARGANVRHLSIEEIEKVVKS